MKSYESSSIKTTKHKINKGREGKKKRYVQDQRTQVLANEESSKERENFFKHGVLRQRGVSN
jgi:hypothetical protein